MPKPAREPPESGIVRLSMRVDADDARRMDALARTEPSGALQGSRTTIARQALRAGIDAMERRARARKGKRGG